MRCILIAALLLAPAIASADDKATPTTPPPAQGNADDCARARKLNKVCELTITGEDIEGGVSKPDGIGFSARGWAYMNSLIRIRRDFIPEIIKSAEDL
jgi:hypothetical protein